MAFRPFQDPQQALGALQEEMNRLFERVWHGGVSTRPFDGQQWAPAVDMYEYPDRYAVYMEVPGVDGRSVDVSHVGGSLTVRGEKRRPADVTDDTSTLRSERRYGVFCRTVELPGGIDTERISAHCQAGVLEITVFKSEASKPKSVRIDVGES